MKNEPYYEASVVKAFETIKKYDIAYFALELDKLVKRMNIVVKTYSAIAKRSDLTLNELKTLYNFAEGACDKLENGRYAIGYDDSMNEINIFRSRFTVAHEIGHIVLEHKHRDDLEELQHNEANCFARNLLVPAPLLKLVVVDYSESLENQSTLNKAFYISYKAAAARLGKAQEDLQFCTPEMYDFFEAFQLFKGRHCNHCRGFVVTGRKCVSCGKLLENANWLHCLATTNPFLP